LHGFSGFALSATRFAPLPTTVRTFGDRSSHVWRPSFAPLPTAQMESGGNISALPAISTGLTYLTPINIFNIMHAAIPTAGSAADFMKL
jgi:hypothetical protein